jgi:hypothetical protein
VAPGPVNINVDVLIVAGAITELKVAVTVALRSTSVSPFLGNVAITVGNAGLGVCSRPHPAARATNTNASRDIFTDLNLRISFSCLTSDKAFRFRFRSRRAFEFVRVPSCISEPLPIQLPMPTRIEQDQGVADAVVSASSC